MQKSATSQGPFCGRHSVTLGWNVLVGQVAVTPVQSSATSQSPTDIRHSKSLASKVGTQFAEVPAQ